MNYLHQENIGGVIAEGLTVLYQNQPEKPIEYLAKWLLQYCKTSNQKTHFYDEVSILYLDISSKKKIKQYNILFNRNLKKKLN